MQKPFFKVMSEFFGLTLSHYAFWIVILGCLITGFGAYVQYRKDIEAIQKESLNAKQNLEAERRRNKEHQDLQRRSNILLDSTESILLDTKQILTSSDKLVKTSNDLLIKANKTILGQSKIIESQTKIINKQVETINSITGSDSIPKLVVVSGTVTKGKFSLDFFIENKDIYPIYELSVQIGHFTGKEDLVTYKEPHTMGAKSRILVHGFPLEYKQNMEEVGYLVNVSWQKGIYSFMGNFYIQNGIPNFKRIIMTHNKSNFHFMDRINPLKHFKFYRNYGDMLYTDL